MPLGSEAGVEKLETANHMFYDVSFFSAKEIDSSTYFLWKFAHNRIIFVLSLCLSNSWFPKYNNRYFCNFKQNPWKGHICAFFKKWAWAKEWRVRFSGGGSKHKHVPAISIQKVVWGTVLAKHVYCYGCVRRQSAVNIAVSVGRYSADKTGRAASIDDAIE